jgi:hypothetical protein
VAYLAERVAAAEVALSDDEFESHRRAERVIRLRRDRLRWCVLHGAGQTVREQSGELCRVLG